MQSKLFGIIIVDFDATDQLVIICGASAIYRLQEKFMIQLGGRSGIIFCGFLKMQGIS